MVRERNQLPDPTPENLIVAGITPPDFSGQDVHGQLAQKAARGAAALGVRQVLNYSANIIGGVILARLLSPGNFGFYAVVGLFLAFLNIFGGTGIAGNLIRTLEDPTVESYRTVFAAQQMVVGTVCVAVWFASPWLSGLYHLQMQGMWFFRLSSVSLFLTSLMVIPQVKMERGLNFDRLALIEVCQAVSFNVAAVLLAWRGFGILAFAGGLILRSAVGALLANVISPWTPRWHWDFAEVKSHATFGVLLQGGQFLAMVKDSITPLFIGMFLGTSQMGYATWAMTFASYPILLLMPMQRLYLPFFAKLQDDKAALVRFVPRSLWIANVVSAPLAILSVALAHSITSLIFGEKWLVALPLFYCFSFINLSAPVAAVHMGLLNAIGKPQLTLWVIFLAMLGIWVMGVPMVMHFGLFGFGLTIATISLVNVVLYWMVWKETGLWPWKSFWPSWPIAIAIGILVVAAQRVLPVHKVPMLIGYAVCAMLLYGASLWFGFREQCMAWVRLLRGSVSVA